MNALISKEPKSTIASSVVLMFPSSTCEQENLPVALPRRSLGWLWTLVGASVLTTLIAAGSVAFDLYSHDYSHSAISTSESD